MIFFSEGYDSAMQDIPKMKTITISTVSEKLKITGSLAKRLIRKMAKDGMIVKKYDNQGFLLYTKDPARIAAEKAAAEEAAKAAKKGKKGKKK